MPEEAPIWWNGHNQIETKRHADTALLNDSKNKINYSNSFF